MEYQGWGFLCLVDRRGLGYGLIPNLFNVCNIEKIGVPEGEAMTNSSSL